MKKLVTLTCVIAPAFVFSQQAYILKGKLSKPEQIEKVFLTYKKGNDQVKDSTVVKQGTFTFTGNLAEPTLANLIFVHEKADVKSRDIKTIYLEKGNIAVSGVDSVTSAKIVSPLNNDLDNLSLSLKPVRLKKEELMKEFRSLSEEDRNNKEILDKFSERYNALSQEESETLKTYITQTKNSLVSLNALRQLAGSNPEVAEIEPLFLAFTPEVKNSAAGKSFALQIAKWKSLAIGSVAPEFTLNDSAGNPVKLSDFRGKYVLIDFWASWCGPCREENPNVVEAYNQFKDKNFTVFGVSLDKSKSAWQKAIETDKLTWTQVSDLKGWNNSAAELYSIQAIPQNFLLDPAGKIIARNLRGEDLKSKLTELIK